MKVKTKDNKTVYSMGVQNIFISRIIKDLFQENFIISNYLDITSNTMSEILDKCNEDHYYEDDLFKPSIKITNNDKIEDIYLQHENESDITGFVKDVSENIVEVKPISVLKALCNQFEIIKHIRLFDKPQEIDVEMLKDYRDELMAYVEDHHHELRLIELYFRNTAYPILNLEVFIYRIPEDLYASILLIDTLGGEKYD